MNKVKVFFIALPIALVIVAAVVFAYIKISDNKKHEIISKATKEAFANQRSDESTADSEESANEYLPNFPFEMTFENGDRLEITDTDSDINHYDITIHFAEDDVKSNIDFLITTLEETCVDFKADIAVFSCYDNQDECICIFIATANANGKMRLSDSDAWFDDDYETEFFKRYL